MLSQEDLCLLISRPLRTVGLKTDFNIAGPVFIGTDECFREERISSVFDSVKNVQEAFP